MEIGIVIYPAAHLPSVWGLTDLLKYASTFVTARQFSALRISHWAAQDGHIVKTFDTQSESENSIDIVVIPPSFEPPISKHDAQVYSIWLNQLHKNGATLCAICSGIFTLLETGLLDGRTVTAHWLHRDAITLNYPDVNLDNNKLIIDDHDIITLAGLMSWMDLALKIVEKAYDSATMRGFAKYLLIDPPSREQSFYHAFSPRFDHGDATIVKVQHWLQNNYATKIRLEALAEQIAMEKRTLLRRFKKATGMTVIAYCQHLRIQRAQELLETTSLSFEAICWQVGYQDSSSFNKIFTKVIGLTSTEYRKRFKV